MAQTKIIVDSNSYFRLAQNIHPLLCQPFGNEDYTLYMHADLAGEIRGSSRIRNRFDWVEQQIYADNRHRSLSLSKQQKKEIDETYDYMWEYVKEEFLAKRGTGPSPVDVRIVATALVLEISMVTDDRDMIELGETYEVRQMTSLGIMKLMLDCDHINHEKVNQVVEQWLHDKDTPYAGWKDEFERTFSRKAPDRY
jgi:hypothetical protein